MKKLLFLSCLLASFACQAKEIFLTGSHDGQAWKISLQVNDDIQTLEDAWIVAFDGVRRIYIPFVSELLARASVSNEVKFGFTCSKKACLFALSLFSISPLMSIKHAIAFEHIEFAYFDIMQFDERVVSAFLAQWSLPVLIDGVIIYSLLAQHIVDPLSTYIVRCINQKIEAGDGAAYFDSLASRRFLRLKESFSKQL